MARLPSNACAYPFKAKMLMHNTAPTPCCRFHSRFLTTADKDPVTPFADIREAMMRNEWHPGCYKCKADEDVGKSSMRTEADEFFDDFTDEDRLEYLEITVGRLCNLACISCGPEYSHTWDKQAVELGMNTQEQITSFKNNQEYDLDNLNLDELKYLRNLKVTGGEPFLHKQFLRFIVRLADAGLAPNIHIEIFTNCTWWPAKVEYDSLLEFRKITINPSLDGYGTVNDFLRWPAKWDDIESTLDKWIDMRNQYDHKVEINTATTVNVVNAPHMFEFMQWARLEKKINVMLQTVYEPHYLSIIHWPDWYKQQLLKVVNEQFLAPNPKAQKLMKAHTLISKLCTSQSHEDNSMQYLKQLEKVMQMRNLSQSHAPLFFEMLKND